MSGGFTNRTQGVINVSTRAGSTKPCNGFPVQRCYHILPARCVEPIEYDSLMSFSDSLDLFYVQSDIRSSSTSPNLKPC